MWPPAARSCQERVSENETAEILCFDYVRIMDYVAFNAYEWSYMKHHTYY